MRLAGRVFAPHFAAPLACRVAQAAALSVERAGGDDLAALAPGDAFEVLELSGTRAWGIAPASGLVGYVDRASLGPEA